MQKLIALILLPSILFFSCNNAPTSTSQQDSLKVVLKTQLYQLKQLSSIKSQSFSINDTVSSTDSLLFLNIFHNYTLAISSIDSINLILPQVFSESDSLLKYSSNDTNIIQRLKYLTLINHQYYQEYLKASAIAEQNEILLQHFSSPNKNH
ncbi:MAG: hypothetical protein KatS3mg027_1209 [Bacteroidia bacterium]|nr:MAG: hypothetical protein KatS3mg027_1209 [Bacteroidia bacterium]